MPIRGSIDFKKSGIVFSANISVDKQILIKDMLLNRNDLRENNYLELPSLVGRLKKSVFDFVTEKVWNRIQSWSSKLLPRAGKTVLIKSVAQVIPSYCMSYFLLPKYLCQEIEKIMNKYF